MTATLTAFLEIHRITTRAWLSGSLSDKGITVMPSTLPWPEELETLCLSGNLIEDVTRLHLPSGMKLSGVTELSLSHNQIRDVSNLCLPEGLTRYVSLFLYISYQIYTVYPSSSLFALN